jgi:hypothetical protein
VIQIFLNSWNVVKIFADGTISLTFLDHLNGGLEISQSRNELLSKTINPTNYQKPVSLHCSSSEKVTLWIVFNQSIQCFGTRARAQHTTTLDLLVEIAHIKRILVVRILG